MHSFVLSLCLSFRNEVILDLQRFQIQPMGTVNPDQLQLLISSATPDASIEGTPCELANVSAIEVETVMMAEDAGILLPGDSTSLFKTVHDNSSSKKDSAEDKQFKCSSATNPFPGLQVLVGILKPIAMRGLLSVFSAKKCFPGCPV